MSHKKRAPTRCTNSSNLGDTISYSIICIIFIGWHRLHYWDSKFRITPQTIYSVGCLNVPSTLFYTHGIRPVIFLAKLILLRKLAQTIGMSTLLSEVPILVSTLVFCSECHNWVRIVTCSSNSSAFLPSWTCHAKHYQTRHISKVLGSISRLSSRHKILWLGMSISQIRMRWNNSVMTKPISHSRNLKSTQLKMSLTTLDLGLDCHSDSMWLCSHMLHLCALFPGCANLFPESQHQVSFPTFLSAIVSYIY